MKALAVLPALFFISGVCFAAEPPSVKASFDKKEAAIGDKINFTIIASAKSDIEIELPDLAQAFKDFEIIDTSRKVKDFFGRKKLTQRLTLQSFIPGEYSVLKQQVKYKSAKDKEWSSVLTDEQSIEIKSVLDKSSTLADIKGPVELRRALNIIILIAVAALILLFVFRKKLFPGKKKPLPEVQPWKAHEIAYAGLEDLRRRNLLEKGMIKQYYSELSDILRHYLENRFSLKAPEMTTEEFIIYVRDYSELAREQKELLKDFLTDCDLVKFARYIPEAGRGETAFETVRQFVDRTKIAETPSDTKIKG